MSDIAIKVENLGKLYKIGTKKSDSFRDSFENKLKGLFGRSTQATQSAEFWALKDVSFEIKKGEAVGIIGRNGAGKSTLLKILSRITEPTRGRIEINGRLSSLLEVGTGFHAELTGRENIFLNGTILGMTRKEVKAKFDEIVDFSGVEKFIDTPVKHYSSGMYVRLAFAVAAHLEPEILIIDEVLAVGDAEFQKKCLGKMGEVAGEGRTVLFVSHNMSAVRSLCSRGIFLKEGVVKLDENHLDSLISYYLNNEEAANSTIISNLESYRNDYFCINEISLIDKDGQLLKHVIAYDEEIFLNIIGRVFINDPLLNLGFRIIHKDHGVVFTSYSGDSINICNDGFSDNNFWIKVVLPSKMLNEGHYFVEVIADIKNKKGIIKPGNGPTLKFQIMGGLPWLNSRPGILACNLLWEDVRYIKQGN